MQRGRCEPAVRIPGISCLVSKNAYAFELATRLGTASPFSCHSPAHARLERACGEPHFVGVHTKKGETANECSAGFGCGCAASRPILKPCRLCNGGLYRAKEDPHGPGGPRRRAGVGPRGRKSSGSLVRIWVEGIAPLDAMLSARRCRAPEIRPRCRPALSLRTKRGIHTRTQGDGNRPRAFRDDGFICKAPSDALH